MADETRTVTGTAPAGTPAQPPPAQPPPARSAAHSTPAGTDPLEAIVDELPSEGPRADVMRQFARAVLRRVSERQLASVDPRYAATALQDSFDFVDNRPAGEIGVRLRDLEVALEGWYPSGTVIETNCEDRQFLLTSIYETLRHLGHMVVRTFHPLYGCERDSSGHLEAIQHARSAAHRESFLQIELGDRVTPEKRENLVNSIRRVIEDVVLVTDDYDAMQDRIALAAAHVRRHATLEFPRDEAVETADLLDWLLDDNFVLLGCVDVAAATGDLVHDSGLGLLRAGLDPNGGAFRAVARPVPTALLTISRTGEMSTVHRHVPMHCIEVLDGYTVLRLLGVFSRKANAEPAVVTPVLRFKLRRILELEDVVAGSHEEAQLVSLFQVLPKDELFQSDVQTLRRTLIELLASEQENDVRVLLRAEPVNNAVSVLVSMPRDAYGSALRKRLEQFLLAQLDGTNVNVDLSLGDRAEAVVRFVVFTDSLPDDPLEPLAREVRMMCRTWEQKLAGELAGRMEEVAAGRLAKLYGERFPVAYRDTTDASIAADDVEQFEQLIRTPDTTKDAVRIRLREGPRPAVRVAVYTSGVAIELSRFLPILESLGLWVVDELPYRLAGASGGAALHLHAFTVRTADDVPIDVHDDGPSLAAAALAMWRGDVEIDKLNRLVLRAGMMWDAVAVLRAYRRYRRQVGTQYSIEYMNQVLVENAATSKALVELFAARFDPEPNASKAEIEARRKDVVSGCDAVARLDHDRILRGYLALVDATLRTNHYLARTDPAIPRHLALKFDCAKVPDCPRPVPYREIFVYAPAVEGTHLRWGPVARGGLRWSDRPDDFRTEVLGLMRAQVLKNAVIVPTGAKGGFVLTRRTERPLAEDVRDAYGTFVDALLDVTDNVKRGTVVPVARRADGDDPYLVVAADKGTATFSDLANAISDRHGFWLGDAFASGGSKGYDHKALGITARGAWVAAQRHFDELGMDLQKEPFTVVGIGDMSGDVFGNGMLRSDQMRLVAAFDHRDVFVDPDPDPSLSFKERERLFNLPQSSWQDYDVTTLSTGGGVWSRSLKSVPLSDEVRRLLRIDDAALSPAELIQRILLAPVDMIFAGGIGTFVRASSEPDLDIDDRANADTRVEARYLRARVYVEGANLSITQRARVEYSRRGGHVNIDAVDNAAGVDCSDHEVNLKMLLRIAEEADKIDAAERDGLLDAVTDDVVVAVLEDCAGQTWALSREFDASPRRLAALEQLMHVLDDKGVVDPVIEALPVEADLRAREKAGAGLTRPEVAVLLAGAKRDVAAEILASDLPDDPALRSALSAYFPRLLAERFDGLLDSHRLRRELIASEVANEVVDRMGATFVMRLTSETGADVAGVVRAWWIAYDVVGADRYWSDVDAPARRFETEQRLLMADALSNLLEALTRDYVRRDEKAGIAAVIERDRPAFVEIEAAIGRLGGPDRLRQRARRAEELEMTSLDRQMANRFAQLGELEVVPDVAAVARTVRRTSTDAAATFLALSAELGLDRLFERLFLLQPSDYWGRAARRSLVDDLDELRREGALRALQQHSGLGPIQAVDAFLGERASRVDDVDRLLREIFDEPGTRLDAIAVAARAVRRALA